MQIFLVSLFIFVQADSEAVAVMWVTRVILMNSRISLIASATFELLNRLDGVILGGKLNLNHLNRACEQIFWAIFRRQILI